MDKPVRKSQFLLDVKAHPLMEGHRVDKNFNRDVESACEKYGIRVAKGSYRPDKLEGVVLVYPPKSEPAMGGETSDEDELCGQTFRLPREGNKRVTLLRRKVENGYWLVSPRGQRIYEAFFADSARAIDVVYEELKTEAETLL